MSLISQTIANLFNGVSQQPPALRSPSQASEQINMDSSLVYGLRQRLPSVHVGLGFEGVTPANAYFHFIDYGPNDRWIAVFADGNLRVFNADTGAEATVVAPSGLGYLECDNPRADIRCLTVADYTFVVNRSVQVTVTSSTGQVATVNIVQSFSDLSEVEATNGDYYKIIGDASNGFTSYYVVRENDAWVETADPNTTDSFLSAELPWRLIKTDVDEFTIEPISYAHRAVGDPETNPLPSFVGKYIRDVFFFRNRLGFITSDTVVMSRAGDYFNFWPRTMTVVGDDDPIDVQIAHPKTVSLWHAVPFTTNLLLFGDSVQFVLTAGDVLSPRTVRVDPTTEFDCSRVVRPIGIGPNVYFSQPTTTSSHVREYYVEKDSITNDAIDVTAHCPAYLPNNLAGFTACSSEDLLVGWTGQNEKLYVYRSKWSEDKRIQSSWSRYEIKGVDQVVGAAFSGARMFMLTRSSDGWSIEYIDFSDSVVDATADDGSPIVFRLDRRVSITGSYDSETGKTTFELPYTPGGISTVAFITAVGHQVGDGVQILTRSTLDGKYEADGDWSGGSVIAGCIYECSYKLSPIYLRDQNGHARPGGRLQLRKLTISVRNSSAFEVVVIPYQRDLRVREWSAQAPGVIPWGDLQIVSTNVDVAVMSNAETVDITIRTRSPLPLAIQSIQWTGFYTARARMV